MVFYGLGRAIFVMKNDEKNNKQMAFDFKYAKKGFEM